MPSGAQCPGKATTGFGAANGRDLRRNADGCFDMRFGGENLRAVVAAIPSHPGTVLLLAAPRADLDGDAVFLRRAMGL